MGQALRRATGRLRSSRPEPPSQPVKRAEPRPPPTVHADRAAVMDGQDHLGLSDPEAIPKTNDDHGMLEERDPGYDSMLTKMVGTITSKPGGKLEMGEALIVEKYKRPMPKLRITKSEAVGSEQTYIAPPGTLTAAQLQQIILLHQGKSEVHNIARLFKIDVADVERIVRFISLPPEDHANKDLKK